MKTQKQREGGHLNMEAEIGVMLPLTKEHLGLLEGGKGKEDPFLEVLQEYGQHLISDCNLQKCVRL